MTRSNFFSAALIALPILFSAPPALASPEAESLIANAARAVSDSSAGSEVLIQIVDIEGVSRFALGRYARSLTEDEQKRFSTAFEAYLLRTFEDNRDLFRGVDVKVTGSTDRSVRDSIVETRVTKPDGSTELIRWRVLERGGAWRVVDVEVLGLWLAIEQRAQIGALLDRNSSIDAAILALEPAA